MQNINLSKEQQQKLAKESRERRELMEQVQNPIINSDTPDEVV